MRFRGLFATLGLLGTLLGGASCLGEIDDYAQQPLATHVTDWRDEVIYQLLVDRFADGDTGNDVRVDRTALGRYQGGDWLGVIQQLDYIQRLGVTTLWISPVVRNVDTDAGFDGYHGYWASDLTVPNPHFGDLAMLRRLVRECHARQIKVIVDIVTNHMGQMFFYDINNNGRPDEFLGGSGAVSGFQNPGGATSPISRVTEYDPDYNLRGPVQAFTSLGPAGDAPVIFLNMPEIFRVPPRSDILPSQAILARPEGYHRRGRITTYDNVNSQPGEQTLLGDFPGGLKDVNTEDPRVRLAMVEAYWRWVELTDIDGFRIDTLKHVEHGFWQYFGAQIRQRATRAGKQRFFMFGEAFDGDDRLVGSYTNPNEMDSVFYFPQKYRVFDNIFQCGTGNTRDIETLYTERLRDFSAMPQPQGIGVAPTQALVNFMDNHDVSRFLYGMNPTVVDDIRRGDGRDCSSGLVNGNNPADVERFRPRMLAALTYLLTEDGIPCLYYGTEQDFRGGNDPSNRERLWDTGFPTNETRRDGSISTFGWTRRLINARRTYPALRRGNFSVRWTSEHTGAEQDAGMLAFERVDGVNFALVVIHAKDGTAETATTRTGGSAMTVSQPEGTELVNILGTEPRTATVGNGGQVTVSLGPWQSAVFVPRSQVR